VGIWPTKASKCGPLTRVAADVFGAAEPPAVKPMEAFVSSSQERPWLPRLSHWLLRNLVVWAVAGIIWILLNKGDRHDMANNFLFLLVMFTAAVYAVALVVHKVKRTQSERSR
jgi:hypothetical protein